MQHKVPFSVLVFDSWYLAEELVLKFCKVSWMAYSGGHPSAYPEPSMP
jgi:hypothetical protein